MSTTIITPERTDRASEKRRVWHIFESRWIHGRDPAAGERALCGHQLNGRGRGVRWSGLSSMERCVVCVDLARSRGWIP